MRNVLGSNLSRDTGYSDWNFVIFCLVSPEKIRASTLINILLNPFKFFVHQASYHSTLYGLDADSIVK